MFLVLGILSQLAAEPFTSLQLGTSTVSPVVNRILIYCV
jgi:hypothetical protein